MKSIQDQGCSGWNQGIVATWRVVTGENGTKEAYEGLTMFSLLRCMYIKISLREKHKYCSKSKNKFCKNICMFMF